MGAIAAVDPFVSPPMPPATQQSPGEPQRKASAQQSPLPAAVVQQASTGEDGDPEVIRFLASINLKTDWAKTFLREEVCVFFLPPTIELTAPTKRHLQVDLETLRMMTLGDLKEMGLPAGPRLKIIKKLPSFQ